MVALKMGSANTGGQLPSSKQLWSVKKATEMESVCSKSATDWGQIGNYTQSFSDNNN